MRVRVMVTVWLGFLLLWSVPWAAAGSAQTTIDAVRLGLHPTFTRLVFDASGAHPTRIDQSHEGRTLVLFDHLKTAIKVKKYRKAASFVSKVRFERAGAQWSAVVSQRVRGLRVKSMILPADPPNKRAYRLVLDFYREVSGSQTGTDRKNAERESAGRSVRVATSGPRQSSGEGLVHPSSPERATDAAAAVSRQPSVVRSDGRLPGPVTGAAVPTRQQIAAGSEKVAPAAAAIDTPAPENQPQALYQEADEYYRRHSNALRDHGTSIINRYKAALASAPDHPAKPLALYRCGESASALGGLIMAEGFFRRLISKYPDNRLVGAAWLQIAKNKVQMEQYGEAIRAFQAALRGQLDRAERIEADYYIGKCFTLIGDHEQAITALTRCLDQDPEYYLEKPDLLQSLGESYFAGKDYQNSLKYLFWYLNIGVEKPKDQNLALARIAEGLQHQGESRLADRLNRYIRSYLPDSDGAVISRIREAERLEKEGAEGLKAALAVYQKLAEKNLSGNIFHLIKFRMAYTYWKLGELEKGLTLVDQFMEENPGSNSMDEFYTLKHDLLKGLIQRAYSADNYLEIAAIDQRNNDLLHLETDPQLGAMIAKSYEEVKLYPSAVSIYKRLIQDDSSDRKGTWLLAAAKCSLEMKEWDEAVQYCDSIKNPALNKEKAGVLARVYFARKKYAEAAASFEYLLAGRKDYSKVDWQVLVDYISCLMALGRYQTALTYLQKASEHPAEGEQQHHLEICLLLGKCYEELNDPQDALPFYEEALQLIPEQDRKDYVIYKIAKLYRRSGKIEQARDMFTQLLGSTQSLWQAVAKEQLNDITIARTGAAL